MESVKPTDSEEKVNMSISINMEMSCKARLKSVKQNLSSIDNGNVNK